MDTPSPSSEPMNDTTRPPEPMGGPRPSHQRTPFPYCIPHEVGSGFAFGAVGGSVYHFFKGFRNSPYGSRLAGGAVAARTNAPRVGGHCAAWLTLVSGIESAMIHARRKEDPWNSIVAYAGTNAILALRQGARAVARSSLFGAGLGVLVVGATRLEYLFADPHRKRSQLPEQPVSVRSQGIPPAEVLDWSFAESVLGGPLRTNQEDKC